MGNVAKLKREFRARNFQWPMNYPQSQDKYEEVRARNSPHVDAFFLTNRLWILFFQIRTWSGPCSVLLTSITARTFCHAINVRNVIAVINIVVTWCGITDTSAAYRSDLNVRTASITCDSVRTCGRTYARSIRIVNFTASILSPTRGCVGRNLEVTEINHGHRATAFKKLESVMFIWLYLMIYEKYLI